MKLDFIPLDRLSVSPANMRGRAKASDIADILPSIRARGVLVPVLVRPKADAASSGDAPGAFEIVAGRRRFSAAQAVASETGAADPLPCAILAETDDASAIEASLIENLARLDPDEVTQWETFTRLVKEGRTPDDIAAVFGLPDLAVRRILALGNLLPRIRSLYAGGKIDAPTIRHLTLASKSQQRAWLGLYDDSQSYVPTGHQLKAWLFGGQSIAVKQALFDIETYAGQIVADLFGEDRYFADADAFWTAQNAAIEAKRTAYLAAGWGDVVIVPPSDHFHSWEYEKAAKRKGGRVYLDVRSSGEVTAHEGYVSRAEARRAAKSGGEGEAARPPRPELIGPLQTYVDLHRHAAVRAHLIDFPQVALRLLVAHAIGGSSLWTVRPEPQAARNDAIAESVETSPGEAVFDRDRRSVLALLGLSAEEPSVVGGNGDDYGVAGLFLRLLDLSDSDVLAVVAVAMGESLASGSAAVEAVGTHIGTAMAAWWQADTALFDLIRDRDVLGAILTDVAGETVARANAKEKARTVKAIIRAHLDGTDGRTKVEDWVPRWMTFPPSAYTTRGGVGTVDAAAKVAAAQAAHRPPDEVAPDADPAATAQPDPVALAA
jgi:ParB family chromosome partitioning protein